MLAMLKKLEEMQSQASYYRRQQEKQRTLDYLKVKTLDSQRWSSQKRNVRLNTTNERAFSEVGPSVLAWKYARRLENREHASLIEGCYGISERRATRFVGALSKEDFDGFDDIDLLDPSKLEKAKQFRSLGYLTITDVDDFIGFQNVGGFPQCSVHITTDWYDPPKGIIPMPSEDSAQCGTHSFSPYYLRVGNKFVFDNSWGVDWGDFGSGEFSYDFFDQNVVEIIGFAGTVEQLPIAIHETIAIGWKWSLSEKFSFHCREIIDGQTRDRIAWAFAKLIGNHLVVYEFFVWPSYRGQGFGRKLAKLMIDLAHEAKLQIRLEISYADTVSHNLDAVIATGKLFGVRFEETNNRFYSLDGFQEIGFRPFPISISRTPPPPAASPLEWIRKKPEQPLVEPVSVPVLFATNRAFSETNGGTEFTADRSETLNYGFRSQRVENIQKFGSAGRSWIRNAIEFAEWLTSWFKTINLDVNRINLQTQSSFLQLIEHLYRHEHERRHLIYIHGFNTTFDFAMQQAARLKADLKLSGNVFLYSWPSAGKTTAYSADEASIEASLPHFSEFMRAVRQATKGDSLSALAHSMGNRLLANWIALQSTQQSNPTYGNALFAAPDVDHDVFKNTVAGWNKVFEKATLYANSADLALQLSEIKHAYARAGLVPPVVNIPGLETLLVQGFDLFDLSHGYFAQAGNTLHDIFVLLNFKASASERPGTRELTFNDGSHCWTLPHK